MTNCIYIDPVTHPHLVTTAVSSPLPPYSALRGLANGNARVGVQVCVAGMGKDRRLHGYSRQFFSLFVVSHQLVEKLDVSAPDP